MVGRLTGPPRDASGGQRRRSASIAAKLRSLIDHVPGPDGTPYSLEEIARGAGLSTSYVGMLKSGRRQNPTMNTLRRLAEFFGVPVSFFYEDIDPDVVAGLGDVRNAERLLNEGEAMLAAGRTNEAASLLEHLSARVAPHLPDEFRGRVSRALGRVYRMRAEHGRAVEALTTALHLLRPGESTHAVAETMLELGKVAFDRQDYREAQRNYESALQTLDTQAHPGAAEDSTRSTRVQALYGLGLIYRHLGRLEDSMSRFTEALQLAEQLQDPRRLAHIYMGLALTQKDLARGDAALEASARALEFYRAIDDAKLVADTQHNMGLTLLSMGRPEDARDMLERSHQAHEHLNDARGMAHDWQALGRYALLAGDLAQAEARAGRALELFTKLESPEQIGETRLLLAEIAAAADREDEARRQFDAAVVLLEQHGLKGDLARCLRLYAKALERWGHSGEANRLYRRSLELYDELRSNRISGEASQ